MQKNSPSSVSAPKARWFGSCGPTRSNAKPVMPVGSNAIGASVFVSFRFNSTITPKSTSKQSKAGGTRVHPKSTSPVAPVRHTPPPSKRVLSPSPLTGSGVTSSWPWISSALLLASTHPSFATSATPAAAPAPTPAPASVVVSPPVLSLARLGEPAVELAAPESRLVDCPPHAPDPTPHAQTRTPAHLRRALTPRRYTTDVAGQSRDQPRRGTWASLPSGALRTQRRPQTSVAR